VLSEGVSARDTGSLVDEALQSRAPVPQVGPASDGEFARVVA
jgi:hypothetical protein